MGFFSSPLSRSREHLCRMGTPFLRRPVRMLPQGACQAPARVPSVPEPGTQSWP